MPLNILVFETFDTAGDPWLAATLKGFVNTVGGPVQASAIIVSATNTGSKMPGIPGVTGGLEERTASPVIRIDYSLPPEGGAERRNAEWLQAKIQGQAGTLYLQTLADDIKRIEDAPALDDASWTKVPSRVDAVKPVDDEIHIATLPPTDELDVDIDAAEFAGNDNGVALLPAVGDFLGFSQAAIKVPLTGPWYREVSGLVIRDLVADANLFIWGDGSATGIRLQLNTGGLGQIIGTVFSPGATVASSPIGRITASRNSLQVGIGRDTDKEVLFVTFQGNRVGSAALSNATAIVTSATDFEVANGLRAAACGEFRPWDISPAEETVRSLANKPTDLAALPAGLFEIYQEGTGLGATAKWVAEISSPANDSTSNSSGTEDFGYGLLGQPNRDEGTLMASAAGQIFGAKLLIEDPASRVLNASSETISGVTLLSRSVPVPGGNFTANSPAPGSITVTTLTGDAGDLRADYTGDGGASLDGEALILQHLTTDGRGPVAPGALASPFIDGPALDQPAGFLVKPSPVGFSNSDANVRRLQQKLCRAGGIVLAQNQDSEWQGIRVPFEPFALTDPDVFTIRQVGGEDAGDIGFEGIRQPGVVRPHVQHTQSVEHSIYEDPTENPDIGTATTADVTRSTRRAALAQFIRPQSFRDEFPGAKEGTVVPGRFTTEAGAFEEASRRGFGMLALPNLRRFELKMSRVPAPGLMQLGAKVVLITSKYKPTSGIPCRVVAFDTGGFDGQRTTGGSLSLVEMGRFRIAPTAIESETGWDTPLIAGIQGDPWSTTNVGFTSDVAGPTITVSFPVPTGISATGESIMRVLFAKNQGESRLLSMTLKEGGADVRGLQLNEVRGTFGPGIGEAIVYGTFTASELADPTGADLEVSLAFATPLANTVDLLSVDCIYAYGR